MVNLKKLNKGQALPLNTIVIAILVIIVLLVIIVFFTSKMGESGDTLNTLSGCELSNALVSSGGYTHVEIQEITAGEDKAITCSGDLQKVAVVPQKTNKDENGEVTSYSICCGRK